MKSAGIGEVGSLRWELILLLILMWFITALVTSKGIKSLGKVQFFQIYLFIELLCNDKCSDCTVTVSLCELNVCFSG